MSYIDSYQHEIIGLFGGIPVYHPLEDIPEPKGPLVGEDFGCSRGQLVLGGGTGEHPAMVLRNPAGAVADFVLSSGDFEVPSDVKTRLSKAINVDACLYFAGWSVEDYHDFFQICTNATLPNPFDPDGDDMGLEVWLHRGFGEFIYYAMPQLAADMVRLTTPLHKDRDRVHYNNILIIPAHMPVYANGGNAFFKD